MNIVNGVSSGLTTPLRWSIRNDTVGGYGSVPCKKNSGRPLKSVDTNVAISMCPHVCRIPTSFAARFGRSPTYAAVECVGFGLKSTSLSPKREFEGLSSGSSRRENLVLWTFAGGAKEQQGFNGSEWPTRRSRLLRQRKHAFGLYSGAITLICHKLGQGEQNGKGHGLVRKHKKLVPHTARHRTQSNLGK